MQRREESQLAEVETPTEKDTAVRKAMRRGAFEEIDRSKG